MMPSKDKTLNQIYGQIQLFSLIFAAIGFILFVVNQSLWRYVFLVPTAVAAYSMIAAYAYHHRAGLL